MGRCGVNIRERRDGRWEARVVKGRPIDRRTNYKYLYGSTYEDVFQKRIVFMMTLAPQAENQALPAAQEPQTAARSAAASVPASALEKATAEVIRIPEPLAIPNPAMYGSDAEAVSRPALQRAAAEAVRAPEPLAGNQMHPNLRMSAERPAADPEPLAKASAKFALEFSAESFAAVSPESQGSTVGEIAGDWLKHKKASVKESTFAYYSVMVENHVLPGLGTLSVEALTSGKISDFLAERKKAGRLRDGKPLADKTVSDLKAIVKQILAFAQSRGWIETAPDCPAVPAKQPPISVLTKNEQEKLENTARQEDSAFSLGVLLSLYGGPRIGEVCGLRWEDFDFENETVRISRTVSRIQNVDGVPGPKTKMIISTPKTECSVRTIPLPASVFAYFREHRKEDGSLYVLTGTDKFMEPRGCRKRFKHLLQRAGVSDHTFHTLRHTYATRCVENGVDFKSLSEMMGHSDIKITMQRYVHPSMDFKKEQVNKLPCFH